MKIKKFYVFGNYTINDGNGGVFLINKNNGIKLTNGLYANYINNYQNNFYDEITYETKRYNNTDVYIAKIPKLDKNNNIIKLYPSKQDYAGQSPLNYAQDNNTTLTINGVITIFDKENNNLGVPTIISNGEIINNNDLFGNENVGNSFLYIGITPNREIKEFKVNSTTNEQLLNSNCEQVFDIYWKLIENYKPLDMNNVDIYDKSIINTPQPRMSIGELQNGDIIIIACDGRTNINTGLTSEDLQNIFIEYGAKNAWNMDGGGSTSLNIKGEKINRNIDGNGTEDRKISYTLNVKNNIINKNIGDTYAQISKVKQNIINQLIPYINSLNIQNLDNNDTNNLIGKIIVGYGNRITNSPYENIIDSNGYFINIPHYNLGENYNNLYNTQFFINRQTNIIYTRNQVNGEFNNWEQIRISDYIFASLSNTITINNNEYNPITFNNIITNSPYIQNVDNSIFKYNGNRNRRYKITASIDYDCKNENTNAYLSLLINQASNIISAFSLKNSERKTLSNSIVISLNQDDTLQLQVQGNNGDLYYRSNLIIEEI